MEPQLQIEPSRYGIINVSRGGKSLGSVYPPGWCGLTGFLASGLDPIRLDLPRRTFATQAEAVQYLAA